MAETYRDGVQMERCLFCGQGVRGADGAPVVVVLASDLEYLLRLSTSGPAELEIMQRLLQALGIGYQQLMQRAEAEAVPAHVKTDRGGLVAED
jgi:hypothetical protein